MAIVQGEVRVVEEEDERKGEKEEEESEGGEKTEVPVLKTALDLREDIKRRGRSEV